MTILEQRVASLEQTVRGALTAIQQLTDVNEQILQVLQVHEDNLNIALGALRGVHKRLDVAGE